MTNEEIIYRASISAGIISEEEAQKFAQSGRRLPIHTFAEWKKHGYNVKRANTQRSRYGSGGKRA